MITSKNICNLLDEAMWSDTIVVKWNPPDGFFNKSASDIASGLKSSSDSFKQAMSRLNFYINRAGDNLSNERKSTLEHAKKLLSSLYQ